MLEAGNGPGGQIRGHTEERRGIKAEAPAMLQHGGAYKELRCMIMAHQSICIIAYFLDINNTDWEGAAPAAPLRFSERR